MNSRKMRGFTLVELMIVLTVFLIACAVCLMGIQPALKQSRVTNGYNTVLNVMRQARDTSVSQRRSYVVQFVAGAPNTITVTPGFTGNLIDTYSLPSDVFFLTPSQFSNPPGMSAVTPDGFGNGGVAVDFDQGIAGGTPTLVEFMPDGSAQDLNGNINNGVVYIARNNDPYSARAITVWGATGRLRGWHLMTNAGGAQYYWRQQ